LTNNNHVTNDAGTTWRGTIGAATGGGLKGGGGKSKNASLASILQSTREHDTNNPFLSMNGLGLGGGNKDNIGSTKKSSGNPFNDAKYFGDATATNDNNNSDKRKGLRSKLKRLGGGTTPAATAGGGGTSTNSTATTATKGNQRGKRNNGIITGGGGRKNHQPSHNIHNKNSNNNDQHKQQRGGAGGGSSTNNNNKNKNTSSDNNQNYTENNSSSILQDLTQYNNNNNMNSTDNYTYRGRRYKIIRGKFGRPDTIGMVRTPQKQKIFREYLGYTDSGVLCAAQTLINVVQACTSWKVGDRPDFQTLVEVFQILQNSNAVHMEENIGQFFGV